MGHGWAVGTTSWIGGFDFHSGKLTFCFGGCVAGTFII